MKKYCVPVLIMISAIVLAEPMPQAVQSWEGEFKRHGESIPIRIKGFPVIRMWEYRLQAGSKGTVIGFSSMDGEVLISPKPNEMGVQPVYTGYVVSLKDSRTVEIFITYSVQGNGGWNVVERFEYDGDTLILQNTTLNSGKPDFEWKNASEND